jgi:hypothetical protein
MPSLKMDRRSRILAFLNSLALKPVRTCQSLHSCCMCECEIRLGDKYRDGGIRKRAHEDCFQIWRKEIR